MFGSGRQEYDRGINTFSPEGRIFQVEYAMAAVKLGSTAIGVRTNEGIILAVEKRLTSQLIESSSIEKILTIDEHIGCAVSGLTADARTLVDQARTEAQNHRFTYDEPIFTESLVHSIADQALDFSDSQGGKKQKKKMARPFGVALLVAGIDPKTKEVSLFKTDPAGNYVKFKAVAIGAAAEGATTALTEQYRDDLTYAEGEVIAISILRQGMEEKLQSGNVEVACVRVSEGCKFRMYSQAEVEGVIARLPPPSTFGQAR
jgi:20S proteasome subunit alpha 5